MVRCRCLVSRGYHRRDSQRLWARQVCRSPSYLEPSQVSRPHAVACDTGRHHQHAGWQHSLLEAQLWQHTIRHHRRRFGHHCTSATRISLLRVEHVKTFRLAIVKYSSSCAGTSIQWQPDCSAYRVLCTTLAMTSCTVLSNCMSRPSRCLC